MFKQLLHKLGLRHGMNFFPCYRRTGGRIIYVSDDYHHVRVKIPLNWKTRNIVNTTFGGSMYAAIDPVYMMMLMVILGEEYVVWDKKASINFKKPGRGTLFADLRLTGDEINTIKSILETEVRVFRDYKVDLVNKAGKVHATIDKTLYIARKQIPET